MSGSCSGTGWPSRGHLITSLPGVLAGDARAGCDGAVGPAGAGPAAVHGWVATVEVLVTAAMSWAGAAVWWTWGPGRIRGMASRTGTRTLLGEQRLKAVAAVVRPDLYPPRGASPRRLGDPSQVGWRLGTSRHPRGAGQLWVPYDRTAGVIGPQGSGKTLDVLVPALLQAPGAALVTLTKFDDLLLSFDARSRRGRPALVLDPFGLADGLPELVWDPVAGCVDPLVAERRAKEFTAGTVRSAIAGGHTDDAARFYAAEAAKVLQAFFHAAALTGRCQRLRRRGGPSRRQPPREDGVDTHDGDGSCDPGTAATPDERDTSQVRSARAGVVRAGLVRRKGGVLPDATHARCPSRVCGVLRTRYRFWTGRAAVCGATKLHRDLGLQQMGTRGPVLGRSCRLDRVGDDPSAASTRARSRSRRPTRSPVRVAFPWSRLS
ncbi:MAG: hypothetical protein WAL50_09580 [Kineosporiaceae bacterium]